MPKPVIPTSVLAALCHSDQRFCRWKLLFYQQLCAKAKEFGEAEFWGRFAGFFMEESYFGFWKSRGNFAFKNAAKIKGEGGFCIWKLLFYQQPCAQKLQKAALFALFCKAEFLDSLPGFPHGERLAF